MASTLKAYRVFIASPGGLPEERKAFREVIEKYNQDEAAHAGAYFFPVGWELTLGGVGRPQALINEEVRKCDYFVLMLWNRWGSNPASDEKGPYTSGTEEEYHVALKAFSDEQQPMRQIVALFKGVPDAQLRDPGEQLSQVIEFQKKLEREKCLLFKTFDVVEEFKDRLRAHLGQWLRDHESGAADKVRDPQPLPAPQAGTVPPTNEIPLETDEKLGPEHNELQEAMRLADEGKLIDAEALFAKAISRGDDPKAFNLYGHFLNRVGRLEQARVMYERILDLTQLPDADKWQAIASGNLGVTYKARGDLDQAEAMHRKSLAINEKTGRPEGMAAQYRNLGLIYQTRGDLDQAEKMHRKSLEIEEKLGKPEGTAANYGNLGVIYQSRGDLDEAEGMHRKSLEIHEKLGNAEGMAANYWNLGAIQQTRGDLKEARALWTQARDLYKKIGMVPEIARVQNLLDEPPPP